MGTRTVAAALSLALVAVGLGGCDEGSQVSRPGQPLVLTGADLPALVGTAPSRIVAFRHSRPGRTPTWTQIPVQVDERKVVAFGTQPANNTVPGVDGTVYGHGSSGPNVLQYADPHTFVGGDLDTGFDADDELVVMVSDAGGQPREDEESVPQGVVADSGVAIRVDDPQTSSSGWVYLFVSAGGLDPAAGQDYVDYDFTLTSGGYKTTYKRRTGYNPETSTVTTPTYRIGFTDRWYETTWRIDATGGSGVDILDGHKSEFFNENCVSSNRSYAVTEGAFVANIDGPVRAIRAYVGASSGPNTQRTHLLYRDQEVIVTDLRVHLLPWSLVDFVDYSPEAAGMTYLSSTAPGGVTVDGMPDDLPTDPPTWEAVTGPQGSVVTTVRSTASFVLPPSVHYYLDQRQIDPALHREMAQCWGDPYAYGASGSRLVGSLPNTDEQYGRAETFRSVRTVSFLPPSDASTLSVIAPALAEDVDIPVTVAVSSYVPEPLGDAG